MPPDLTGYTDEFSIAPGESVRFMVSCGHPSYEVAVVRLIHGDRNPAGPGFKEREVGAAADGTYPGRVQTTTLGSHAVIAGLPSLAAGVGLAAWIFPTRLEVAEDQCVVSLDQPSGAALGLYLAGGRLSLRSHDAAGKEESLTASEALQPERWSVVYGGVDAAGAATIACLAQDRRGPRSIDRGRLATAGPIEAGDLFLAAAGVAEDGPAEDPYDGKIAAPAIFGRPLGTEEIEDLASAEAPAEAALDAVVGAWRLGADPSSDRFPDASGRARPGRLVNRPMAAVTDHRWERTSDWKEREGFVDAVHFHCDDLADAGWESDFSWSVPDDTPSGVYAARIRAGDQEDHIPFVVRPPRDRASAEIGVLLPDFTYMAYANERLIETVGALGEDGPFEELRPDRRQDVWSAHAEYGMSIYDSHLDGSGCCYSTSRRPILNWRPDYRFYATGAPVLLGADLYLTDWLEQKGHDHDSFTDTDLHFDGQSLLDRYKVIITGGHPEYWSGRMLDALNGYLEGGGRLMYLGGNGFYWVTSLDPAAPQIIEVRRGHSGTRTWESKPGETRHSTTGEPGGLWRHRGRSPNELVGIGFASQGFGLKSPGYRRDPDATGPVAELLLDGVEGDFGDYGLLMGGAAGHEIDRADPLYGTPPETLLLASSTGHDDNYQVVVEDLWYTVPQTGGEDHPGVRSDITFLETGNDGAVFSAGSINWRGSLSHDGYENGVSRLTENVLRAFLEVDSWATLG